MPYLKDRPRPTAYADSSGTARHGRGIVLATGRGDVKVTPGEARALAAELLAAAGDGSADTADTRVIPAAEVSRAYADAVAADLDAGID